MYLNFHFSDFHVAIKYFSNVYSDNRVVAFNPVCNHRNCTCNYLTANLTVQTRANQQRKPKSHPLLK